MRFSDVTLEILANFGSINQGMIFKPGNELATMSIMRNIFAVATIEETIPVEFAIYDLNELLELYFTYTRYEKKIRVIHLKHRSSSGGWKEKTKKEKPIKEQLEELQKKQLKLVAEKDEILKEIEGNTVALSQLTAASKSVRTGIEKEVKSAEKKVSDLEEKIHELTLEQGELIAEDNKRKAEAEEAARKRKEEEEKRKEEEEKRKKETPVWKRSEVIDYSGEETAEEGINFREEYLLFKSEESKLRYFYSNPSVVISPGDKRIKMQDVDNKFVLPVSILKQIWKYNNSKLKVKDLTSTEAGFKIWNRTNVGNEIEFNCDYQMKGGEFMLKIDNLRFLPLDYDVEINSKGIAHFISRSPAYNVEYFMALESMTDDE